MAEQDNKTLTSTEDQAVDKAAEAEAPKKKHVTTHRRKKHSSGGTTLFVAIVVVAAIAAGGAYLYDYVRKFEQQVRKLSLQQAGSDQQSKKLQEEYSSKWGILKQQQDELSGQLVKLLEKNKLLRKDWLVLEAEYLIQLANHRLLLERDVNTAIIALQAADARLRDTSDPGVVKVRKSISDAVQSLKQVPQSDLTGLSLTLSTLYKDVDKLPLATPDPLSKEHQEKLAAAESRHVKDWKELPAAIWRDLKNLIVIRNHEDPVQPLLSPEQRFFLLENLRLQLEQARLAMLSGEDKVFKERIATATQWIQKHFDKQAATTKAMLDTLQQLSTSAISPALPDISATYQALESYRLGNGATKPAVKTEAPKEQPKAEK